ncbi:MAG TPA: phosphodiester glycosidase family protein [bacterium]|nr:phosphodiester glycosidase family protein [bacterium]
MRRSRHRRSHWCAGLWTLVVVLLATGPVLGGAPPLWPGVKSSRSWTTSVAPGVQYTHFRVATSGGPLSIHHLRIDLTNPSVRFGMGLAHDQLISPDETVSSMVGRTGAIAGVNGDFFDIRDSGMPLNIVVKNGEFLRSPMGRAALAIGKDGAVTMRHFQWDGSVLFPTANARYWLAGFNTGIVPEGIVALSNVRGYGAPAPPAGVHQTVVELAPVQVQQQETARPAFTVVVGSQPEPPVAPEVATQPTQYTVGQVWPQQAYYAPFPKGVMLLVGRGNAADWLQQHVSAGMPVELNLATTPDWRNLHLAIGGGPMLVENGYPLDDPHSPVPHERDHPNPVLAVGISRDSATMLLVAIDGRQPKLSMGLTQPQLAAYMRWLGAYQAMAFDSGGSVTMVARFWGRPGPTVVNSPSDGHERPVGNALLIFSSPNASASR